MQVAGQAISKISGLMGALYDGQIQKIDEEKEIHQAHYDEEIERIEALAERGAISTEEAEARKAAAEKRRSDKEAELEKKKQELEYKKAVWEKATAVAQTGIATALGIMQAMATGKCEAPNLSNAGWKCDTCQFRAASKSRIPNTGYAVRNNNTGKIT